MPNLIACPNCGEKLYNGAYVCKVCGKVYCGACDQKGKNPWHGGNNCPRCGSYDFAWVQDWTQIAQALRNSVN